MHAKKSVQINAVYLYKLYRRRWCRRNTLVIITAVDFCSMSMMRLFSCLNSDWKCAKEKASDSTRERQRSESAGYAIVSAPRFANGEWPRQTPMIYKKSRRTYARRRNGLLIQSSFAIKYGLQLKEFEPPEILWKVATTARSYPVKYIYTFYFFYTTAIRRNMTKFEPKARADGHAGALYK